MVLLSYERSLIAPGVPFVVSNMPGVLSAFGTSSMFLTKGIALSAFGTSSTVSTKGIVALSTALPAFLTPSGNPCALPFITLSASLII